MATTTIAPAERPDKPPTHPPAPLPAVSATTGAVEIRRRVRTLLRPPRTRRGDRGAQPGYRRSTLALITGPEAARWERGGFLVGESQP